MKQRGNSAQDSTQAGPAPSIKVKSVYRAAGSQRLCFQGPHAVSCTTVLTVSLLDHTGRRLVRPLDRLSTHATRLQATMASYTVIAVV